MAWALLQYDRVYNAFLEGCDDDSHKKVVAKMAVLLMYGNLVSRSLSESLGDGLFELWFTGATGIHIRILYGFLPGRRVLVVDARYKDQKKLPPGVIEEAKRRLAAIKASEQKSNGEQYH